TMINRQSELEKLLEVLRVAAWVALDTEADSLHAYPEKVCLLQLQYDRQPVLVDPLAGMDCAPLFAVLRRPELILHGADYDLRLLHRSYGFVPTQVFDTMLAARLAGHRQFSLADLLSHYQGITLEKGPQTANWARRPLTDRMDAYARNDVRFLKPLADHLRADLQRQGRLAWHREACTRLVAECTQPRPRDPDRVWRLPGCDRLDRRGLGVLRELWHWREQEALRRNRPPYFVLSHETLLALAAAATQGRAPDALFPRRFPPAARQAVTAVMARSLALAAAQQPERVRPPRHRSTPAEMQRFDEFKKKRDHHAHALGIDPALIASRATLVLLARDGSALQTELMEWQRQLLS
ncbi:MAG: HRDC domain-containing protein, partial [Verrucomicrobia bacterium]|nr:HRDC domain-containing protein [Verrucomicrobiota bacterium]